jgi:hypothetical protein
MNLRGFFAVRTGLEPATSAVTGRHSNQLNYRTIYFPWLGFVALSVKVLQM